MKADQKVSAACRRTVSGWQCHVTVREPHDHADYEVSISEDELSSYGAEATPEQLVVASFRFLLDRESKEAILPRFGLSVIKRYFADYETEIGGYLASA